ncbi:hypothetical protein ABZX85_44525 [Streptomyces sp. NPDC004539]|uniref:hypothetical protein n=1 Tax=Streptomyces sp. NPDC004539 TaxID=3154280 RepID=UPI0033A1184D
MADKITSASPYRRSPRQRRLQRLGHRIAERLAPQLFAIAMNPRWGGLLSRRPYLPTRAIRRLRSPARAWTEPVPAPPEELRTVPGIRLDPKAQQLAFEQAPLHDFFRLHADTLRTLMPKATIMAPHVTTLARVETPTENLKERQDIEPTRPPVLVAPTKLTAQLKKKAAELGISACGVAVHDPKYTFAEYVGNAVGDRVVICIQEQNFDATQRIPSHRSEEAALSTYGELEDRLVSLAEWLRAQGYRARPETYLSESMVIPYAVAAGLGQLGLNGQLLTPYAGSRCRINILTTDAPLDVDEPVDYGLEGVCDRCQICVRRCPVGAIPNRRKESRGVTKAKLNTKRCLPLMVQSSGCSICMKTCPVQRYGLADVLAEYERSGRILGKDTDDLEGFDWPMDGRHYGPGEKPHIPESVTQPPSFAFDPDRTTPPEGQSSFLS